MDPSLTEIEEPTPVYLLDSDSVFRCPHGGKVIWAPMSFSSYRIDGRLPMLTSDRYTIIDCIFMIDQVPNPCTKVNWINGSTMLVVRGRQPLTSRSIGMCVGTNGMHLGPVRIIYHQTTEMEPTEFTRIPE